MIKRRLLMKNIIIGWAMVISFLLALTTNTNSQLELDYSYQMDELVRILQSIDLSLQGIYSQLLVQ